MDELCREAAMNGQLVQDCWESLWHLEGLYLKRAWEREAKNKSNARDSHLRCNWDQMKGPAGHRHRDGWMKLV